MSDWAFLKKGLSSFELKIIACVLMVIDHIGMMLFPYAEIFRIIGRLSFPVFAYFIAEGTRFTKSKAKRFWLMFIMGAICETGFFVFTGVYGGNILLTFSVSILLIYLLEYVKKMFATSFFKGTISAVAFVLSLCATYLFCKHIGVDYGFFGVMLPVFCVAFDNIKGFSEKLYSYIDRKFVSLFMLELGLVLLVVFENGMSCQVYCLLSALLLLMYNGQRGKYSFKYGFYLFYPFHFLVIKAVEYIFFQ